MKGYVIIAKGGVGLEWLDADSPHAEELMRCDGEYELWRLPAHE